MFYLFPSPSNLLQAVFSLTFGHYHFTASKSQGFCAFKTSFYHVSVQPRLQNHNCAVWCTFHLFTPELSYLLCWLVSTLLYSAKIVKIRIIFPAQTVNLSAGSSYGVGRFTSRYQRLPVVFGSISELTAWLSSNYDRARVLAKCKIT